jgi:hypothetical protein
MDSSHAEAHPLPSAFYQSTAGRSTGTRCYPLFLSSALPLELQDFCGKGDAHS